jgi:putative ABC transport system permease protein
VKQLDIKLFRDFWHLRGHAVATAVVIACGIAGFVAMSSIDQSLTYSRDVYYTKYRFADVFSSLKRAPRGVESRLSELPGVAEVETRVIMEATLQVEGMTEPVIGRLVSLPEAGRRPKLNNIFLRRGRWPEPGRSEEVILHEAFADAHGFSQGDSIEAVLNGETLEFKVVGVGLSPEFVYQIRPGDTWPDDRRYGVVWMEREAVAGAFRLTDSFNDVLIRLEPSAVVQEVLTAVDNLLEPYGGFGAVTREDQMSHRYLTEELKSLRASARIIPTIFLLVAAFLLNVVLNRLVMTQREQIGTLKALGVSIWAIGGHYFKLTLLITLLGLAAGLLLGGWMGKELNGMYQEFFRFPALMYRWHWRLVISSGVISVLAGLIGTGWGVWRVMRLQPAMALKPAPPPTFKPTWLERAGGYGLLSPMGRMVARSVERRPGRTAFATLGIAMAIGIQVIGSYGYDVMDYLVQVQFGIGQREDMLVTFREPVSTRALDGIRWLEGVQRVEPRRVVPVTLQSGHIRLQTAITGLDPDSRLYRLMDRQGRFRTLPESGLMVSTYLAERLRIRQGDRVWVKPLEGHRRWLQLRVAALLDDMIGLSVYAPIAEMGPMMDEAPVVTSAALKVDPRHVTAVQHALVDQPMVASVGLQRASLAAFERMAAEMQRSFSVILGLFAAAIAVGVVYNSCRIALSERSRELASLRVLGFTQNEISALLFGELALQLFLAIPLGIIIGYLFTLATSEAFASDLYRFPVMLRLRSYGQAVVVVLLAGIASALWVRRGLRRLDLIGVLKTRD